MKPNAILYSLLALLFTMPTMSYSQYLNKLYDFDTTYDWGWNISLNNNNNYFITGGAQNLSVRHWGIASMIVSSDGALLNKNTIRYGNADIYLGNAGEIKKLPNGGYISPLIIQWPDSTNHYFYSTAGFIKYNAVGDTVFFKTYTDTSVYFDVVGTCAVMPDGGYIGGGRSELKYTI